MDMKTFEDLVRTEDAARRYLVSFCWKNHQRFCPRCKNRRNYRLGNGRRRCSRCRYTFHDFTGRWINHCRLSCSDWLRLVKLFELKQTAVESARQLGLTYNTTYKAMTVMRMAVLSNALDARQLLGASSPLGLSVNGMAGELALSESEGMKAPVFGIMEKNGLAFVDHIPGFDAETILHFTINFKLKMARLGNIIYTDRYQRYDSLVCCVGDTLPMDYFRNRSKSVAVDGKGGFWRYSKTRLVKYHGVTWRRFPLYLKELEFRYNNRRRDIFPVLASYLCQFVPDCG